MLNVCIYDDSRLHRSKLIKITKDYAQNNKILLGNIVSIAHPNKMSHLPAFSTGFYLLNLNDLEKKTDGIQFALDIRNNDFSASIVFITSHDIFETGQSIFALRSLKCHLTVMSFLAKDSEEYEYDVKKCIAAHVRKITML